jgi:hypothetical protein
MPWDKGLFSPVSPILIPPEAMLIAEECYPDLDGAPRKRGARKRAIYGQAGGSNTIQVALEANGILAISCGGFLFSVYPWRFFDGIALWVPCLSAIGGATRWGSGTSPISAVSTGRYIVFAASSESEDTPTIWADTSNVGALEYLIWDQIPMDFAPTCFKHVCSHADRLWGSGDDVLLSDFNHHSKLWYSAIRDPLNFILYGSDPNIGPGYVYIGSDEDDMITGLCHFLGDLYVFKRESIWRVIGATAPFHVTSASRATGAVSGQTVVNIGSDVLFLSYSGVQSLSASQRFGDVEERALSFPIQDQFDALDKEDFQNAWAVHVPEKRLYLLGVPQTISGVRTGRIFAYNYARRSWMGPWTMPVGCLARVAIDNIGWRRYSSFETVIGRYDGYLDALFDSGSKDYGSTDYTAKMGTGYLGGGDVDTMKSFRDAVLYVQSNAATGLDFYYDPDGRGEVHVNASVPITMTGFVLGEATGTLGECELGYSDDVARLASIAVRIPINEQAKILKLRIEQSDADLKVVGYHVEHVPAGVYSEYVRG